MKERRNEILIKILCRKTTDPSPHSPTHLHKHQIYCDRFHISNQIEKLMRVYSPYGRNIYISKKIDVRSNS